MTIMIIMILATLLAGSVCINICMAQTIRDMQAASELEWGDPESIREVDE